MKEEALLRKILEDNDLRITKTRLFIFNLLQDHETQSIADLVERSANKVDRVSVYRIVDLYEKLGVIKRINIGWKYKLELSDIFQDHHHHISCIGCGRMVAIREEEGLENLIDKLGKTAGFILTSHQLELQGYCGKCQKQREKLLAHTPKAT